MPAGPGARELTEFFAPVDAGLAPGTAEAPKIQRSDREILNLLAKRASTLHLGTANYCWLSKTFDNKHWGSPSKRPVWPGPGNVRAGHEPEKPVDRAAIASRLPALRRLNGDP